MFTVDKGAAACRWVELFPLTAIIKPLMFFLLFLSTFEDGLQFSPFFACFFLLDVRVFCAAGSMSGLLLSLKLLIVFDMSAREAASDVGLPLLECFRFFSSWDTWAISLLLLL